MPAPSHLPPELLDRPFTTAEALELGVSDRVLRGDRFRSPFFGVHLHCDLPRTTIRCAALALVLPCDAAFSHATAAALCELPLPDALARQGLLHVSVPAGTSVPHGQGVVGHEAVDLRLTCRVTPWRLPVVHPWRTWCDLVPLLRDDEAIVLGDAVVGRRGRHRLERVITGRAGERGVVRMRRLFELVREGVDSPMETRTRLLVVRAGLPEPECGKDVYADDGYGWLARPDLCWPDLKVAVEYDGDLHRTGRSGGATTSPARRGWRTTDGASSWSPRTTSVCGRSRRSCASAVPSSSAAGVPRPGDHGQMAHRCPADGRFGHDHRARRGGAGCGWGRGGVRLRPR